MWEEIGSDDSVDLFEECKAQRLPELVMGKHAGWKDH
jgi:hypothetical protein